MNHNMNYGSGYYGHSQQQQQQHNYPGYPHQHNAGLSPRYSYGCEPSHLANPAQTSPNFGNQNSPYGPPSSPYSYPQQYQQQVGGYYNNPSPQGSYGGRGRGQVMGPPPSSPNLGLSSPQGAVPSSMHGTDSSDLKQTSPGQYGGRNFNNPAGAPANNFVGYSETVSGIGQPAMSPADGNGSENLRKSDRRSECLNSPAESGGDDTVVLQAAPSDNLSNNNDDNNSKGDTTNNPGDQAIHPGDSFGVVKDEKDESSNALERLQDLATSAKLTENVGEGFRQHRRNSGDQEFGSNAAPMTELSDIPELNDDKEKTVGDIMKKEEDGQTGTEPNSGDLSDMRMSGNGQEKQEKLGGVGPLQTMINNRQDEFMQQQQMHCQMPPGNAMQQFPMGMGPYGEEQQQQQAQQHQQQQQPQMWNNYNNYSIYPPQNENPLMNDPFPPQGMPVSMPGGAYDVNGAGSMIPGGPPSWWISMNQQGGDLRAGSPSSAEFRVPGGLPSPGSWTLRGTRPPRYDRKMPGGPRPGKLGFSPPPPGAMPPRPSLTPPSMGDSNSPYPFPGGHDMPPDMMPSPPAAGNRKRGPGRPTKTSGLLDPSASASSFMPNSDGVSAPPGGGKTKGGSANAAKKRYTCEICQKRFSTAWYVRVHRKSHNGERPYICHNCGKGFMLPNVLQVHLRKCEKNANPSATGATAVSSTPSSMNNPSNNNPDLPNPHNEHGLDHHQIAPPPAAPSSPPGIPIHNPPSARHPFSDHHPGGEGPGMLMSHQQQQQQLYGMGGFNQRYGGYPGYPSMPGDIPPPNFESQGMMGNYNIPSPHHQQQQHQQQQQQGQVPGPPPPLIENSNPNHAFGHEMYPHPPPGSEQPQSNDNNPSPTNHFLANDRPPDKGGGGNHLTGGRGVSPYLGSIEKSVPPGVDPELYCTTCEIQFEEKANVEEHQKTHRPYMCEVCEKRFSQKCNLITHMRLHTGERPYPCSFCEKRFTQKGNLDAHLKTHTKEKPYPCIQCGKKFAFKSSMLAHMKQSHQQLLNTPGISPLSGTDFDMDDDISSIKQQLKYANAAAAIGAPVADLYQSTPPSPPASNNFSSGIPTPQSSLDSLSGSQHGHSGSGGYPSVFSAGSSVAEQCRVRDDEKAVGPENLESNREDDKTISISNNLIASTNQQQTLAIS